MDADQIAIAKLLEEDLKEEQRQRGNHLDEDDSELVRPPIDIY